MYDFSKRDFKNVQQYSFFFFKSTLHIKHLAVRPSKKGKSICCDEMSSNQEITYIKITMQPNGYPLDVINKAIKETQLPRYHQLGKINLLELLSLFVLHEKSFIEKLCFASIKFGFTTIR